MATFGTVNSSTSLNRQLIIPVENFRVGGTAPTENLRGTTPGVPVFSFNATNELASAAFQMPIDWDNGDISFVFDVALSDTETNNDTVDITVDYVAWEVETSSGNSITKTSTQVTGQGTVTTANGLAIGDVYRVSLAVSAGDATNPLANANGIALELHLTNVTGVAEFDLLSLCVSYTALY